jgi:ubiquinone biosynthesis monooxygenase Coq7
VARSAQTVAEKMIKVDHAGENGAVNIYRGQRLSSHVRARSIVTQLKKNQQHEEEHREIFRIHLHEIGVRRCVSYHACGMGGMVLGLITGLIGPSAIAATTFAVERVVLRHLGDQMDYLKNQSATAFHCVSRIIEDEEMHRDLAEKEFDHDNRMAKVLLKIVQFSTDQVIRFGMR